MESVWVVSFPKSGNTWVRTLLRNYVELKYGNPPMETSDVVPYSYHVVSPFPLTDLDMGGLIQLRPAAMMHLVALCHSRERPAPINIIKSHAAAHAFMGIVLHSPLWMSRTIYIYRDPRDILPSLADHMGKTMGDTVEIMANTNAVVGQLPKIPSPTSSWSEHLASWLRYELIKPLFVSYEDLSTNPSQVLKEMVKHCQLDFDIGCIHDAVEMSDFGVMQADEAKYGFHEKSEHQKKFFRRGIVGSHKDELTDITRKRVELDHQKMMKRLGYLDD